MQLTRPLNSLKFRIVAVAVLAGVAAALVAATMVNRPDFRGGQLV